MCCRIWYEKDCTIATTLWSYISGFFQENKVWCSIWVPIFMHQPWFRVSERSCRVRPTQQDFRLTHPVTAISFWLDEASSVIRWIPSLDTKPSLSIQEEMWVPYKLSSLLCRQESGCQCEDQLPLLDLWLASACWETAFRNLLRPSPALLRSCILTAF